MDFGKAFTFVFEDPNWFRKLGIVALVGLIPIIGQFVVMGYAMQTLRNVLNHVERPLPELDFSTQLGLGFKSFVVELVCSIPLFLLYIPIIVIVAIFGGQADADANSYAAPLISIISLCFGGLMLIYALLMAFVLPAALARFVAHDSLGAGLQFGEVFKLVKANPGAWLLVVLGTLVTGFISPLGMILCVIGVILTMTYALVVNGHLYAQAYQQSVNR